MRKRITGGNAMDAPSGYLQLGFILISYSNLVVIGLMIIVFVIALYAPFHGVGSEDGTDRDGDR